MAIKRGKEKPRLQYPPNRIYIFSGEAFSEGIQTHVIDAAKVRVYSPEKTLADIFKFRDKVGADTIREAVDMYKRRMKPKPRDLLKYAKIVVWKSTCGPILKLYRNVVVKDIAKSIHQRLLNGARDEGQPFNELFQYFFIERFIYRLSKSRTLINLLKRYIAIQGME